MSPGPNLGSTSDSFGGLAVKSGLQLDWIPVPALALPSGLALSRFTPLGLALLVRGMGDKAPTSRACAEDDRGNVYKALSPGPGPCKKLGWCQSVSKLPFSSSIIS